MGNFFRNLFGGAKDMKIVMLGLNNAGKTTLLYKLNLGEVIQTAPTTSFNTETVTHDSVKFQVWDLAGQSGIRPYWKSYYPGSSGVVFVIDATDRDRLKTSVEEFTTLLTETELAKASILVLANKSDLEGGMNAEEISDALKLSELKDREWGIYKTSALTGEGLKEAFSWLAQSVKSKK
mgnify:CR=1 FL=1